MAKGLAEMMMGKAPKEAAEPMEADGAEGDGVDLGSMDTAMEDFGEALKAGDYASMSDAFRAALDLAQE